SSTTSGAGSFAYGGSWRSYGRAATSAASAAVGGRVAVSAPLIPSRLDATPSATVVVVDRDVRSAALDDPEHPAARATTAVSTATTCRRAGRACRGAGGAVGMPRSGSTTGSRMLPTVGP